MAIFYVTAGIMHFVKPKLYISIIPPYIPQPRLVNRLVGFIEVILGLGLVFDATQTVAAYGIILLLIAVFPANLYMYQRNNKGLPKWLLLLRLPLQLLLIGWAYVYT
nr:DoxX family protein [Cyclobacterium lianum]